MEREPPRVPVHTVSNASEVNAGPVSSVGWAMRAHASASVKSPRRSDSARTLNALPPEIAAVASYRSASKP